MSDGKEESLSQTLLNIGYLLLGQLATTSWNAERPTQSWTMAMLSGNPR